MTQVNTDFVAEVIDADFKQDGADFVVLIVDAARHEISVDALYVVIDWDASGRTQGPAVQVMG